MYDIFIAKKQQPVAVIEQDARKHCFLRKEGRWKKCDFLP